MHISVGDGVGMHACICVFAHVCVFARVCVCVCMCVSSFCLLGDIFMGENYT